MISQMWDQTGEYGHCSHKHAKDINNGICDPFHCPRFTVEPSFSCGVLRSFHDSYETCYARRKKSGKETRKKIRDEPSTVVRISYCAFCDWFTQQTLYLKTYPRNSCSKCRAQCVGVDELGRPVGGRGDVMVNVKIPAPRKRYSQITLRKIYLENNGHIPTIKTKTEWPKSMGKRWRPLSEVV